MQDVYFEKRSYMKDGFLNEKAKKINSFYNIDIIH